MGLVDCASIQMPSCSVTLRMNCVLLDVGHSWDCSHKSLYARFQCDVPVNIICENPPRGGAPSSAFLPHTPPAVKKLIPRMSGVYCCSSWPSRIHLLLINVADWNPSLATITSCVIRLKCICAASLDFPATRAH